MIAVVFALEFEAAEFVACLGRRLRVESIVLGITGERAAAALAKELEGKTPSLVVSAGFGGGLVPGSKPGDVYVGSNVSDPSALACIAARGFPAVPFATAAGVLETSAQKLAFGRETGAVVGDMETSHLAAICAARGIPFLGVRALSDVAEGDLPVPGSVLIDPETNRPSPGALFRHVFTHPTAAPGVKRLVSDCAVARRSLADALLDMLPDLLRPGVQGRR